MFIILLAALANVDREQLEAAEIDGAGRFRVFFRIVLPAIMPVLRIALLIRGLDLFRIFDAVWQLTRGGPGNKTETLSIFMYIRGFQSFETSYTAATGRGRAHRSVDRRRRPSRSSAWRSRDEDGNAVWHGVVWYAVSIVDPRS